MITLITGGPGMGKTALAVSMLVGETRPIFTNIRGLTLDHSKLPKLEEWTTESYNDQGTSEHNFSFPPGALVVIDECQQFFRPRATGSKVPPYISAFETHRHQGIDFILITQGSGLLDNNIRKLVKGGLHIFLKSSYIGRFRYEKSEVINEEDKTALSLASRRKYSLPVKAFSLYKSSELHTKPPRAKLPFAVYGLVAALIIGGFLFYKASARISTAINPDAVLVADAIAEQGAAKPTPSAAMVASFDSLPMVEATTPTDDQNPLSAPLYAAFAPPVVAPVIIGCISSSRACTCYTQQQTPVWLPEPQCRLRAAGAYYDPYRQLSSVDQNQPSQTKTQEAPEAREGSGNSLTVPGVM